MEYTEKRGSEPRTILFATVPFGYVEEKASWWASIGVSGFMLAGIMSNWDSDVWKSGDGRIVGNGNPLLNRLKRMNDRCAGNGIDSNFIKVAFYSHVPDWFDDRGWEVLSENFRQGAIFARDAGFRGMAIDIEYISEIYDLSWPAYHEEGYRFHELRSRVESRGIQMVESMLEEFPSMELLHLPQSPQCYGKLASDIFTGMFTGMAKGGAPGGLHILTEATYTRTDPGWLIRYRQDLDRLVEGLIPERYISYWRKRCSISFGLWPLGYYRKIFDDGGNFLGYGGKSEKFGDEIVGSTADKSENYGVEEFRRQFAVSKMACDRYVWIYCHGSTFWELDDSEMQHYGGSKSDALPVVDNLEEYIAVLRRGQVLADRDMQDLVSRIRSRRWVDFLTERGSPRQWNLVGPFSNECNIGFEKRYPPEEEIDLDATYNGDGGKAGWQVIDVPSTGHVNLSQMFRPPHYRLAYAHCFMHSEKSTTGKILLGSDDGVKVWIDGELVHELDVVRGAEPDDDCVSVELPGGRFSVLVKVCNRVGGWGFYFRIVGDDGRAIPGLKFSVI